MGEQSTDTEREELSLVKDLELTARFLESKNYRLDASIARRAAEKIKDLENTILSDKMLKRQVNME